MLRMNFNASSILADQPGFDGEEYIAKIVVRRERDGSLTPIEVIPNTWVPTSKEERECVAAGCFGCIRCTP